MLTVSPIKNADGFLGYLDSDTENRVPEIEANDAPGHGGLLLSDAGRELLNNAAILYAEYLDKAQANPKVKAEAYDLTFSAPKSVSIEALALGNADMLEAHGAAVGRAMAYTEHSLGVSLAWESYEHHISRGVEGQVPDPHLHTHVLVANFTREGETETALNRNDVINGDAVLAAGMAYRHALADELHMRGYSVAVRDGGEYFDLAGYSKEWLDAFSKRSQQIRGFAQETFGAADTGDLSHAQRSFAAKATRGDKDDLTLGAPEQIKPATRKGDWGEESDRAAETPGLDAGRSKVMASWQTAMAKLETTGQVRGEAKLDDYGYINNKTLNADKSLYALARIPDIVDRKGALSMDRLVAEVMRDDLEHNKGLAHADPVAIHNRVQDMVDKGQLVVDVEKGTVATAQRVALDTFDRALVDSMLAKSRVSATDKDEGRGVPADPQVRVFGSERGNDLLDAKDELEQRGKRVVHLDSDVDVNRVLGQREAKIDLARNLASDFKYAEVSRTLTSKQQETFSAILNNPAMGREEARAKANAYVRKALGKEKRDPLAGFHERSRKRMHAAGQGIGLVFDLDGYGAARQMARRGRYISMLAVFSAELVGRAVTGLAIAAVQGVAMGVDRGMTGLGKAVTDALTQVQNERALQKDLRDTAFILTGNISASQQSRLLSFADQTKAEVHFSREMNRFGDLVPDARKEQGLDKLADRIVERAEAKVDPGEMPLVKLDKRDKELAEKVNEKIEARLLERGAGAVKIAGEDFFIDAPVRVTLEDKREVRGTVIGATEDGQLLVQTNKGQVAVEVTKDADGELNAKHEFASHDRGMPLSETDRSKAKIYRSPTTTMEMTGRAEEVRANAQAAVKAGPVIGLARPKVRKTMQAKHKARVGGRNLPEKSVAQKGENVTELRSASKSKPARVQREQHRSAGHER